MTEYERTLQHSADEVAEMLAQVLEHRWHTGWRTQAQKALVRYNKEREERLYWEVLHHPDRFNFEEGP